MMNRLLVASPQNAGHSAHLAKDDINPLRVLVPHRLQNAIRGRVPRILPCAFHLHPEPIRFYVGESVRVIGRYDLQCVLVRDIPHHLQDAALERPCFVVFIACAHFIAKRPAHLVQEQFKFVRCHHTRTAAAAFAICHPNTGGTHFQFWRSIWRMPPLKVICRGMLESGRLRALRFGAARRSGIGYARDIQPASSSRGRRA